MPPEGARIAAAVSVLCLIVVSVALGYHRLLTGSVDLAHHVQMADAVLRHGLFSTEYRPYLADFNVYPKLSHAFAAMLIAMGVGPIDALTILGVLSAAACWFCLTALALRMSMATLLLALVLVAGLTIWPGVVFGDEIVDNFFYSQLVAQGVCLAGVLIGADLAWRSPRAFAVFAPTLTYFCGWLHIVGAMDLALALSAMAGLRFVHALAKARRIDGWAVLTIAASAAALLLGPSFQVMGGWVNAVGGVNFFHDVDMLTLGLTGAAMIIMAGAGYLKLVLADEVQDGEGARGRRAAAAVLGLAAAIGFCVFAQWLLIALFHTGAEYAVRKHAFGLFGVLAFALPTTLWVFKPNLFKVQSNALAHRAGIIVAPAAIVAALMHGPSRIDVGAAQESLAGIRALRPTAEEGGRSYLFVDTRGPPLSSYLNSIVGLRVERDENAYALVHTGHPVALEHVARVITPPGDPFYDDPDCARRRVGDVVIEAGACVAPQRVPFSPDSVATTYLRSGWSAPETTGVWSVGPLAELVVTLPRGLPAGVQPILQLGAVAYLPKPDPVRVIGVQVEDEPISTFEFSAAFAMNHTFALPIPPAASAAGRVRVRFHIAHTVTPASLGLGDDLRALGVGLTWMAILPEPKTQAGKR